MNKLFKPLWALLLLALSAPLAVAQEAEAVASNIDSGDTAWMLTATVLVLLMTIPGLSLFYGGLVKSKNILSVLMQCFFITAVMSILWVICGYSLAAGTGNNYWGDLKNTFLQLLSADSESGTIPESVFVTFQMTFIIITPALIVGAFAERMKFSAVLIFTTLWAILSYCPIWHMAWGGGLFSGGDEGNWLMAAGTGAIDFAGGTVVHINAGVAGLVACIMLRKRKGYPNTLSPPSSVPFTIIGAALLWVGWFGFNAGSAVSAGADAGYAMLTTQIATAAAVIGWVAIETFSTGKPTAVGAATGAVAGLVAITPASGSSTVVGAIIIGLASGIICFYGATKLKQAFGYDDSLDVFGVHGIGGIVGALLTGVFIREGAGEAGMTQVIIQAKAVGVTIVWSGVASVIALTVAKFTVGLRVDEEDEETGLDQSSHGESAYS
ncbi:MAG TPA: ammonium transporter [Verrucomicrobia bacterium]|nr:ammonium transporter [Verrucomicrobiota bacterium]